MSPTESVLKEFFPLCYAIESAMRDRSSHLEHVVESRNNRPVLEILLG